MPRIKLQHEGRSRFAPFHLAVAHGGRIPRSVASSRRFAAPDAGHRGPAPEAGIKGGGLAPEAGIRPGAPVAGGKFPAPSAGYRPGVPVAAATYVTVI